MNKILIGVPCMDSVPVDYVTALLRMTKPIGTEVMHFPLSLVYVAREQIVRYALDNKFTHVFFLDSDMVPPRDIIPQLLAHDKDIVSGAAYMRKPPYKPCFYEKLSLGEGNEIQCEPMLEYPHGLVKVEGVGMACALIRTKVFTSIYEAGYPCFFPVPGYGEDLGFCLRARKCGYDLFVDTTLQVGHIGSVICSEDTYKAWNGVKL
ncbi:MAG: glycosyltransferase family 2 protein [Eubacteriales bacterium]